METEAKQNGQDVTAQQMTLEQAYNNVATMAARAMGTKDEHVAVEMSLIMIKRALFENKKEHTTNATKQ